MAQDRYGYRHGPQCPVTYGLDSSVTTVVNPGDHLKLVTAGYVAICSANDTPIGVAMSVATPGAADGDTTVQVDISEWSIYEYPPDAGTVTAALIGLTMDLGGARSINIDASTDDNVKVVNVDTAANTVLVRHLYPTTGVV